MAPPSGTHRPHLGPKLGVPTSSAKNLFPTNYLLCGFLKIDSQPYKPSPVPHIFGLEEPCPVAEYPTPCLWALRAQGSSYRTAYPGRGLRARGARCSVGSTAALTLYVGRHGVQGRLSCETYPELSRTTQRCRVARARRLTLQAVCKRVYGVSCPERPALPALQTVSGRVYRVS